MKEMIFGDCLDVLPTLAPGSIDACITDPPYGIERDPRYHAASEAALAEARSEDGGARHKEGEANARQD